MKRVLLFCVPVLVASVVFMSCQSSSDPVIPQPTAANVSVTSLSVSPEEVQANEKVNIVISITNDGGIVGTYPLSVAIDGVPKIEENIIINGNSTLTYTYPASINNAGTYNVTIGDMSASFTVLPPAP